MRRFTLESSRELGLERLGDYLDGVSANLEAHDALGLVSLAPPWRALLARCDDAEARQKAARRALNRARIAFWVSDGEFDRATRELSSESYHLAKKDALAEPYVSLFGAVTANEIEDFGEAKASAFGRRAVGQKATILAAVEGDASRESVGKLLDALGGATDSLTGCGAARESAVNALAAFDVERRQLLRDAIVLIADTEVGILTLHKGRRDLVDRVLALDDSPPAKKKKPAAEAESPA